MYHKKLLNIYTCYSIKQYLDCKIDGVITKLKSSFNTNVTFYN